MKEASKPFGLTDLFYLFWWLLPDSNWGHKALQASALPTELKSHTGEQRYFTKEQVESQGSSTLTDGSTEEVANDVRHCHGCDATNNDSANSRTLGGSTKLCTVESCDE